MATTLVLYVLLSTVMARAELSWPKAEWPTRSLEQSGFSKAAFERFLQAAFAPHLTFATDSVVVVKDGYLVYEWYTNGYDRERKHAMFSLGKTVINSLFGAMEAEGLLRRDDPVNRYYPAIGNRPITIANLLHMSSGLEWIEEDRENLLQSDPWFAFYSLASYKDMPAWVAGRPSARAPDTKFNYSSGDSALLLAVMRGVLGENRYARYPWEKLFAPLGMRSVAIERDGAGNLALHGMGYASALDIARIGLLYLRNGKVDGKSLWPADWVSFTAAMAPSQNNHSDPNDRNLQNNQAYGAQIWLNVRRPEDGERPYPELPENALLGLGTRGQILLILPDEKLILVRNGTDTEPSVTARKDYRHRLFKLFYGSLKQGAMP